MHKQSNPTAGSVNRRRGIKTLTVAALCCLLFVLMILAPADGISGARAGLTLCAEVVVPSLFPFLVVSVFVINLGLAEKLGRLLDLPVRAIFRLPGSAAAVLGLGLIGGYPVGAKACAELCNRKAITKPQAERLLVMCINSSPAFIIGAVGAGLLGSTQAGILLYIAHVTASLVIGLFSGLFAKKEATVPRQTVVEEQPIATAFVRAVTGSVTSILNICAFVVLFSSLVSLFIDTGILGALCGGLIGSDRLATFTKGFLEVSNGCAAASHVGGMMGILLISAFLSWSGLSVIFQVVYAVRDAGLSVRGYTLSRLPHMLLSVLFTTLLFKLFPVAIPTIAQRASILTASFHTAPGSAALLIVCSLLLLSLVKV